MIVGKVVGTIVSTQKDEKLRGFKLQVVQPVDIRSGTPQGKEVVAVDTVGAGRDSLVLLVSGSSARQTERTSGVPVDLAIVGIIDEIQCEDAKAPEEDRRRKKRPEAGKDE